MLIEYFGSRDSFDDYYNDIDELPESHIMMIGNSLVFHIDETHIDIQPCISSEPMDEDTCLCYDDNTIARYDDGTIILI